MLMLEREVNDILRDGKAAGSILREIYELYRLHQKPFSMSYICRKAGIPSKGYLAFVMAGERRLNPKYWDTVCSALRLSSEQAALMQLLLERDATSEYHPSIERRINDFRERLP